MSPEKARAYLHDYNVAVFDEARAAVAEETADLMPHKMNVLAASIDPKSETTVDIVLYSDEDLDATKIDLKRTYAGVGRASVGNTGVISQLAQPVKHQARDVDGDGKIDLVLSFQMKPLALNMLAGANYDLWLYTYEGKDRIAAMDDVEVQGENYKGAQKRTENADL